MHRGYIPIWRKLFDHPFWTEKRSFSRAEAWIDILSNTHYLDEPKRRLIKNQVVIQNYGEAIMSTRYCGERWGWHKTQVLRFFDTLRQMEQIETKCDHNVNKIIVINFAIYDPKRIGIVTTLCPQLDHVVSKLKN